jgi:16S rRNA (guanine527-N7)-methyltransferase
MTPEALALRRDAAKLGVTLSDAATTAMLTLLDELQRWSRAYNLTALTDRAQMVTHHLLDSLSVAPLLADAAITRIADIGTGAGFPGLPLALACPDRQFTLVDSNGKKIRFVQHAVRTLGLKNVTPLQARAEELTPEKLQPPQPVDCVVARAYAALPEFLHSIEGICKPSTLVIAMKGRAPLDEIAALPAQWRVIDMPRVEVPGLSAERHLVRLLQA